MQKVYDFLDKLGFSNKDFETLGLLIQIYSGILLFFVLYALYALLLIGSDFTYLVSQFDLGVGAFGGFVIGIVVFVILILSALLVLLFLVGKKAKDNYNKPEVKDSLKKWAITLAILVGVNFIFTLSSLSFGTFIFLLIQILVTILYFYFIERIEEFNSPEFVAANMGINNSNISNTQNDNFEDIVIDNEGFNTVEEENIETKDSEETIIVNNEEIK